MKTIHNLLKVLALDTLIMIAGFVTILGGLYLYKPHYFDPMNRFQINPPPVENSVINPCYERVTRLYLAYNEEVSERTLKMLCGG